MNEQLEDLSRAECLRLLADRSFAGRVGFVADDLPVILPVNYLFDDESVVYRTAAGTRLDALDAAWVAFEVDNTTPLEHAGWSVLVVGIARRITDAERLDRLRRGPLYSWARRSADQWFSISIERISGRRIPAR